MQEEDRFFGALHMNAFLPWRSEVEAFHAAFQEDDQEEEQED